MTIQGSIGSPCQVHGTCYAAKHLNNNNLLTEFILLKYIFAFIILPITKTSYVVQIHPDGIRRIVSLFEASKRYVCLNNLTPLSYHPTVLLIALEAFYKN